MFRRGLAFCWFAAGLAAAGLAAAASECDPSAWPATQPHPPQHTDTETAVAQLLAQMSLEEKVAQMIQADIAGITPAELAEYKLGSILAGGGAAPDGNVRSPPRAWLDLVAAYHDAAVAVSPARHPAIPILFGIDAVHGDAKVVGATVFPHNVALGAARDPDLVRRIGAATAEEVASTGVDWTFAPTVAVARDVRWGRAYESYSEDPQLVASYAAAMVEGLQGAAGSVRFMAPGHTLSSVKHFLGDGGTENGRDQGENRASLDDLRDIHGRGYGAAIAAGAQIVMASYNSWRGTKMHADRCLITGVLKGRLGFDGFVVGDWNAHEQIPGCTKFSCPAAINAGVDMLMAPDSWRQLYQNTLAQVHDGIIPAARIDDAVRRILRVKARAGLLKRPAGGRPTVAGQLNLLGSPAHRELAREAVRRSLVLLKNDGDVLPLRSSGRILVVGAAADDIGAQSGGWTVDWQGDHNTNADFPQGTSIFAGIAAAVHAGGGEAALSLDGRFEEKPDAAIVVFGERPYAEFEGDRENLEFSPDDRRHLSIMSRLRAAGIPIVSVFLSGRPLWVNRELNASDAFVAAWLPGSEGEGIADVLFRGADGTAPFDFSGRLEFSWPSTAMPVRYAHSGKVRGSLFPRGYGLSYRRSVRLRRLSELAHVPAAFRDGPSLLHAAHVTAPWSVFVADHGAQVRLTTKRQASPSGAVTVALDRAGAVADWRADQTGLLTISGRPADYSAAAADGLRVAIRYRVMQAPSRPVRIGVICAAPSLRVPPAAGAEHAPMADAKLCNAQGGAMLDFSARFAGPKRAWSTLSIPWSCLAARGADLHDVESPLAIATDGTFRIAIAEVRFERAGEGVDCGTFP